MIKCLIVDDEQIAQQIVEQYIMQTPELTLVAKCRNALEAFAKLEQHSIDLIFLDIEMPLVNGLSFLQTLTKAPKVIFTTAYPNYAVQAFDLDVVDYLLKPFSYERFLKAVNKVKEPAVIATENNDDGHLLVKEKGGLIKVPYNQIIFIKASKDYVKIVTNNQQYLASYTMKNLETLLPPHKFVRIHKSYIAGLRHVKMIKTDEVVMEGSHVLPLSINYKEDLLALFRS
ncbi:LytR/AlgR family response regulator transcription factor [Niastella sp. OAS944]|uniref:LytR/AlgR family response regulator transcription factor n=1 Tax=Niastella sp. OAS944 TaxID=2664089 RepID=UPI003470FD97|nr:DNA-binding LytR/AlgR family response regulator [Chitinophagaceae bacterium OAS944]